MGNGGMGCDSPTGIQPSLGGKTTFLDTLLITQLDAAQIASKMNLYKAKMFTSEPSGERGVVVLRCMQDDSEHNGNSMCDLSGSFPIRFGAGHLKHPLSKNACQRPIDIQSCFRLNGSECSQNCPSPTCVN